MVLDSRVHTRYGACGTSSFSMIGSDWCCTPTTSCVDNIGLFFVVEFAVNADVAVTVNGLYISSHSKQQVH